jgi:hypothetical protein
MEFTLLLNKLVKHNNVKKAMKKNCCFVPCKDPANPYLKKIIGKLTNYLGS